MGILVVLTLGATFWRAWAADKTAKATQASAEAALTTADSSLQAQLADRFGKAVEQLGSDNLTVRLGGIYSLESIARSSETHHWPIMETLTTYVRVNAPATPIDERDKADDADEQKNPTADIQAILTVIGRRNSCFDPVSENLDLRQTDLQGAFLKGVNLEGAEIMESQLSGADLEEANLKGVSCTFTDFDEAFLVNADLSGAYLGFSDFDLSDMEGAILNRTNLEQSNLTRARNLTIEQILTAIWNEGLPPGLPDDIQRQLDEEQASPQPRDA